jgi:hypothetical protein
VQVECDTTLKSSQGELQVCFRPHPNQRFEQEIMNAQSFGSPNRDKRPFGCGPRGEAQSILYRGGGGFPRVRAVVSQVNPKLPVACLSSTKGAPECELTNLLVSLMQVRVSE